MKKENRDLLESLIEGTLKEAMGNTDDNYKVYFKVKKEG